MKKSSGNEPQRDLIGDPKGSIALSRFVATAWKEMNKLKDLSSVGNFVRLDMDA